MTSRINFEQRDNAFNRRLYSFAVVNNNHIDIREFLIDAFDYFDGTVRALLDEHLMIKLYGNFHAIFEKVIDSSENELRERQSIYINTRNCVIDRHSDLTELYENDITKYILDQIDEVITQGSGFSLAEIIELNIQVSRYEPLRASSHIELPKTLKEKHAIINVINKDEMCFKWAILSALYPASANPARINHYAPYANKLNFDGIDFPVKVCQIDKFENQNPSISINVYMYGDKNMKIQPIRLTKKMKNNHIHLLLTTKEVPGYGSSVDVKTHYCWIKHLSRLLSSQVSKHKGMHFFCDRCLNYFQTVYKLVYHQKSCFSQNECQIEMPAHDKNTIKFNKYKNQLDCPFIIYADVETLLKKPTTKFCKIKDGVTPTTIAYQEHEVYSIGYYFHCAYDE